MTETNKTNNNNNNNVDVSYLKQRVIEMENEVSSIKSVIGSIKTDIALLSKDGHNFSIYLENLNIKVTSLSDLLESKLNALSVSIEAQFDKRDKSMSEKFEKYVTNIEFKPVKLIAYGFAGGVLLTVLGALLSQVLIGA